MFFDSLNFQSSVVTCTQDAKTGGKRICKERKPTPCTGTGNAFGDRNGANCGGQEAEKAGQVSSWRSLLVKQVDGYSKCSRSGKVQTESLSGVATSQRGPRVLAIWQDRCVLGRRWMQCTEQSCCCHNTSWKAMRGFESRYQQCCYSAKSSLKITHYSIFLHSVICEKSVFNKFLSACDNYTRIQ